MSVGNQLVARLDYFQNEQKGPITRAEFLAQAWKLANDKARALAWIVEAGTPGAKLSAFNS